VSEKSSCSCCSVSRETGSSTRTAMSDSVQVKQTDNELKEREKMALIPGGEFLMGTNEKDGFPADGEGPVRKVKINSFLLDRYAVTNEEFSRFVEDTDYVTEAERFGWSFVFHLFVPKSASAQQVPQTPWWFGVEGANWYQPEGPESSIEARMDHPVLHVSWNDANAYCEWAGKRLPTEAEWEYAARGNLEQKRYAWGDELTPGGIHQCNIWQGDFPRQNTEEDGFIGTAPAQSFPPNGFGLYNVAGNVWEWCSDWFARSHHKKGGRDNPQGPSTGQGKVMRGGSYLCHDSYCNRYRVAARTSNTSDSSAGNIGFRCAADI
jgi:formylglycine-generating enzyme